MIRHGGTVALTTQAVNGVTYRTSSKADNWNNSILNFWDDFSADGMLTERSKQEDEDPMASLSVNKTIAPQSTETFTFISHGVSRTGKLGLLL